MRRDLDTLREITTHTFACLDTDWFGQHRSTRLVRVRDAFCFMGIEYGATPIELSQYFGDMEESSVRKARNRAIAVACRHLFYGRLLLTVSREYRMRQVIRWRTWPSSTEISLRIVEADDAM